MKKLFFLHDNVVSYITSLPSFPWKVIFSIIVRFQIDPYFLLFTPKKLNNPPTHHKSIMEMFIGPFHFGVDVWPVVQVGHTNQYLHYFGVQRLLSHSNPNRDSNNQSQWTLTATTLKCTSCVHLPSMDPFNGQQLCSEGIYSSMTCCSTRLFSNLLRTHKVHSTLFQFDHKLGFMYKTCSLEGMVSRLPYLKSMNKVFFKFDSGESNRRIFLITI